MIIKSLIAIFLIAVFLSAASMAQTTAFSHQGQLNNSGNPANGNFDFEFKLFDTASGGTQQGATAQRLNVAVANGIFTVSLDFGAAALPGADRFLDISVRNAGVGAFTPLLPRQPVTSSPYAVRSLNAGTATGFSGSLVGDVTGTQSATSIASNAVTTTKIADSSVTTLKLAESAVTATRIANGQVVRNVNGLTDGVVLSAGSNITITPSGNVLTIASTGGGGGNSILNQTTQQAGANFNISGTGTANVFNAVAQYNINGGRILSSAGSNNLFAGIGAGNANPTGGGNTFVGGGSGGSNTTGGNNSFVGANAGTFNIGGSDNSFFGAIAGRNNTSGGSNAFFGKDAGQNNTEGSNNSFFGKSAGLATTGGSSNVFVGANSGQFNSNGNDNAFFGATAGFSNTSGGSNAFFGTNAGRLNSIGNSNSFFGTEAGRSTTSSDNAFVGVAAGFSNTSGGNNSFFGPFAGNTNTVGNNNTLIGYQADVGFNNLQFATAIGARSTVLASNTVALGRANGSDAVVIYGIAGFGSFQVCLNSSNQVAGCSSSLRYKENIGGYSPGMSFINQLRPISFDWKDTGMKDVGFGAEDIEKIDPRFVTYNKAGQVEGVKYDRLSVAFVNAFEEQQTQIEALERRTRSQQELLDQQQTAINALTKLVCLLNKDAAVCK